MGARDIADLFESRSDSAFPQEHGREPRVAAMGFFLFVFFFAFLWKGPVWEVLLLVVTTCSLAGRSVDVSFGETAMVNHRKPAP